MRERSTMEGVFLLIYGSEKILLLYTLLCTAALHAAGKVVCPTG